MKLSLEQEQKFRSEIDHLYLTQIEEETIPGLIHFGIFEESLAGEVVKAIASVALIDGDWYLWGCVVKPEYRGQGLQGKLIEERLNYLRPLTDQVRVLAEPWNIRSIENLKKAGFSYEKDTVHADGTLLNVFLKSF